MIQNCLLVMCGGALGALMRYGVGRLCDGVTLLSMPLGTFLVNIVGCFVLGLLTGLGGSNTSISRPLMLMLTTGMCGAFTTFSTFSGEGIKMIEGGQTLSALFYVAASVTIGFALFYLGQSLTK